ncbi:sensor histidine kinase [Streptacidiphilus carbonis]|uniref:sensor histidine kinase n=1 Tax=Streptacidiphilus carbonis TaxID=105422 RepID=UPI001F304C91|nr:sensor histidine kinase [Streptacidiphilus carbonis]
MGRADDRGRDDERRQLWRTPAAAGAVLALCALTEWAVRTDFRAQALQLGLLLGLLALASTLSLALPRPALAAGTVTLAVVLSLVPFHTLTGAGACAELVALYRLGRSGAQAAAAVLAVPFLALALSDPADTATRVLAVLLAALAPAAAWTGAALRARDEALESSAARQVVVGTLLEHTARGERARIARELHDVVAHHISMISVQAETARLTTPDLPAAGAQRLSAIGDTARAALTEMRRLLGVLREDAGTDSAAAPAERRPQPGLGELNELLDDARDAAGTGTRLILRGLPDRLDPGIELAAYRIVQEALTNARRHAPGAAVDVELHYTEDSLRLRIRDNGPGPAPTSEAGGHGLLGMRERAAAVGGELRTGPAPGGGFLVETELPTRSETAR